MISSDFFSTWLKALNPTEYPVLIARSLYRSFAYLCSLILLCILIAGLTYIPVFLSISKELEQTLSHFDSLTIKTDITMNSPLKIPKENPVMIINTNQADASIGSEDILITNEMLYYKTALETKSVNITGFGNLLEHKKELSMIAFDLLIALIPAIIMSVFLFYLAKYLILVLVATSAIYIVLRLTTGEMKYTILLRAALYASTLLVTTEIILHALGITLFPINVFLILTLDLVPLVLSTGILVTGVYFINKGPW